MKIKMVVGASIVLIVIFASFIFLSVPQSPFGPFPSPNAYDMLIQAGRQMTPLPMDFDSSQDVQSLQSYLDENADSLALFDLAIDQQCKVPMSQIKLTDEAYESLGAVRNVFRLHFVRARVAELEGRSDDASERLSEMALLGTRCSNGGLMVHQLVSIAVEKQAIEALMQLAPNLSEDHKAVVKKSLVPELTDEFDIDSEFELVMEREQYAARERLGLLAWKLTDWQIGEQDLGQKSFRQALVDIREERKSLLNLLEPSATPIPWSLVPHPDGGVALESARNRQD